MAAGATVNTYQETALKMAAAEGHTEAVKLLLAAGADVNARDMNGWTALMEASDYGHTEIVKLLIAAGATED
ncbi:MAG: ankyrin repeat domain-containing protein [Akkermansia sp.]|nr:ankyrin repeat domain-containing protein [Akkermansia sp.]